MKIRKILPILLVLLGLSCNFVTRAFLPATPTAISIPTARPTFTLAPTLSTTPEASNTPEPNSSAQDIYIPPACQGMPVATLPPATMQALPTEVVPVNPPISTDKQLVLFDKVVSTINKVYLYPDFNGVDWKGITATYRARVKAGLDTEAFYSLMVDLVRELKDNHSAFLSPANSAVVAQKSAGNPDFVGIGIVAISDFDKKVGDILIVYPGSPAERAGLKAHDSILAIDGLPVIENNQDTIQRARGPQCSAVTLSVQSPGMKARQVTMLRYKINSPGSIDARLVTTRDGSRIGYIFIDTFEDKTVPDQVRQALQDFGKLDGLIIDNRMNSGGWVAVMRSLLGFFTDGLMGHWVNQTGSSPFVVSANPVNNSQTVPLVLVVGRGSASGGELFTGMLQDIGRAKVVGETSPGIVEALSVISFEDGSHMNIAVERFDPRVSHINWEKRGIIPDVQAYADWDTVTLDTDPAILAALKIFGHQ
jgi:C-terminal peptidase prc